MFRLRLRCVPSPKSTGNENLRRVHMRGDGFRIRWPFPIWIIGSQAQEIVVVGVIDSVAVMRSWPAGFGL
jgi:hypothetical protein